MKKILLGLFVILFALGMILPDASAVITPSFSSCKSVFTVFEVHSAKVGRIKQDIFRRGCSLFQTFGLAPRTGPIPDETEKIKKRELTTPLPLRELERPATGRYATSSTAGAIIREKLPPPKTLAQAGAVATIRTFYTRVTDLKSPLGKIVGALRYSEVETTKGAEHRLKVEMQRTSFAVMKPGAKYTIWLLNNNSGETIELGSLPFSPRGIAPKTFPFNQQQGFDSVLVTIEPDGSEVGQALIPAAVR